MFLEVGVLGPDSGHLLAGRGLSELVAYLRQVEALASRRVSGRNYRCYEGLVLDRGFVFTPPASPEENRDRLDFYGVVPGPAKSCFETAGRAALERPDVFFYVEGWAAGLVPIHHAWLVTRDGVVVDPVWAGVSEEDPNPLPGEAYVGVPFHASSLRRRLLRTEVWGLFYFDHSLVTEGLPEAEVPALPVPAVASLLGSAS